MEYIVIDTESCTGRSDDGSLCSIGYVICDEKLKILKQEDILINPLPKRFMVGDKKNLKRTGVAFAYTVEQFRNAPRFSELYSKITELFNGRIVLGFSMGNDIKYLNSACDSFSLPRIEYSFYDIQFIFQLLHPEESSFGLKTLNLKYGIDYVEHRSDEDAAASVTLLNNFLYLEKTTLEEVIEKYQICKGINTVKGYHNCFSKAVFKELYGLKPSKRIQSYVLLDYLKKLPKPKKTDKKVCFSYKIEKMDVNFVRTLIDLCYEKGYAYDHDTDVCLIYVSNEKDDKRIAHLNEKQLAKIKRFSLTEFCDFIGYDSVKKYSDTEFLTDFYSKLTL